MQLNSSYIVQNNNTQTSAQSDISEAQVSVQLSQIIPVLVNAVNQNVAWINDFKEETVSISRDLHEVIQVACQLQQQPSPLEATGQLAGQ